MQVSGTGSGLPIAITRTKTWHRYTSSWLVRQGLVPYTLELFPGFKVKIPPWGGNQSQPINMPVATITPMQMAAKACP